MYTYLFVFMYFFLCLLLFLEIIEHASSKITNQHRAISGNCILDAAKRLTQDVFREIVLSFQMLHKHGLAFVTSLYIHLILTQILYIDHYHFYLFIYSFFFLYFFCFFLYIFLL